MYKVVVPGDFISEEAERAGEGTYVEDGKVYAMSYGIVEEREEIKVVALSGKYMPAKGDVVIGRIAEISFPFWIVDIASPYEARLHISELAEGRDKIEFGSMSRYLDVDDFIVAKVLNVNVLMRIELALKEEFKMSGVGCIRLRVYGDATNSLYHHVLLLIHFFTPLLCGKLHLSFF